MNMYIEYVGPDNKFRKICWHRLLFYPSVRAYCQPTDSTVYTGTVFHDTVLNSTDHDECIATLLCFGQNIPGRDHGLLKVVLQQG